MTLHFWDWNIRPKHLFGIGISDLNICLGLEYPCLNICLGLNVGTQVDVSSRPKRSEVEGPAVSLSARLEFKGLFGHQSLLHEGDQVVPDQIRRCDQEAWFAGQ
jgi:hypothetical protein